jgi:UDP-N-acetylmuramoylalanine--D-glutamate ligase
VVLNVTPDHLDRHREMRVYSAAKERILLNQGEGDAAVLNLDNQVTRAMAMGSLNEGVRRLFFTTGRGRPKAGVEGAYMQEDVLTVRLAGEDLSMITAGDIPLEGRHNLENCLAVAAVAGHLGIDPQTFAGAVSGFRALPHRMEPAGTVRGIRAVNDSKATNVDSTLMALSGMAPGSVLLILGGQGKGGDFSQLRKEVADKARGLFLIGEDARLIAEAMDPAVPAEFCDDLDQAVARAVAAGSEGDVLLLSPACASFDMFDNFEHRGEAFKDAVRRAADGGGD